MTATKPPCFENRPHLKHDTVEALELISAGIRLWQSIPPRTQDILDRYIKGHIYPGSCLRGLLSGDVAEFEMRADTETLAAGDDIERWLDLCAPADCFGDEDSVTSWLMMKPATGAA